MILAIKTADMSAHITLLEAHDPYEATASVDWESGRQLSEQLLGRIEELLSTYEVAFDRLTAVVVYAGPGSFTSLRIGHAVANALAESLNIPITSAGGDHWQRDAIAKITGAHFIGSVVPEYGSEAHITRPKT